MKKFMVCLSVLLLGMVGSVSATTLSPGLWDNFQFSGTGTAVSETFDFTVGAGYSLFVTDAYAVGDQFEVYDGVTLLGATSFVAVASPYYFSPYGDQALVQSAYDSGLYSVGEFSLFAGTYTDINLVALLSPFGGGGAYVKIDASSAPVPEPSTILLLGSGLAGLAFYRRKRK